MRSATVWLCLWGWALLGLLAPVGAQTKTPEADGRSLWPRAAAISPTSRVIDLFDGFRPEVTVLGFTRPIYTQQFAPFVLSPQRPPDISVQLIHGSQPSIRFGLVEVFYPHPLQRPGREAFQLYEADLRRQFGPRAIFTLDTVPADALDNLLSWRPLVFAYRVQRPEQKEPTCYREYYVPLSTRSALAVRCEAPLSLAENAFASIDATLLGLGFLENK